MLFFIISLSLVASLFVFLYKSQQAHNKRIESIPLKIHVNGIRGKSTVTRLIAGMLREAGYKTLAKTTGSAARIIHCDGSETAIQRYGAPTISEQVNIIREHFEEDLDALVIECMAVNPEYQDISQHQIIKANVGIISNVREDHQDLMGESLAEIAHSLSNTIPQNGCLITAEDCADLQSILAENTKARGSQFELARATTVKDSDLAGFDYIAFKENIALGLKIAEQLNIPREVALRGMRKARPDIGAVRVSHCQFAQTNFLWAPMFAVNDRESTLLGIEALKPHHDRDAIRIGILNNRLDRVVRAQQFAEIAAKDMQLDYYITLGAFEHQVTDIMVGHGFPQEQILNLAAEEANAEALLKHLAPLSQGRQLVLIGLVNIHTQHAEALMHYFTKQTSNVRAPDHKNFPQLSSTPTAMPMATA